MARRPAAVRQRARHRRGLGAAIPRCAPTAPRRSSAACARRCCTAWRGRPTRTRRWWRSTAFWPGLPAGVQLFSLFEANPPLVDLIVDIAVDLARAWPLPFAQRRRARRGHRRQLLCAVARRGCPDGGACAAVSRAAAGLRSQARRGAALDEGMAFPHRRAPPARPDRRRRGRAGSMPIWPPPWSRALWPVVTARVRAPPRPTSGARRGGAGDGQPRGRAAERRRPTST